MKHVDNIARKLVLAAAVAVLASASLGTIATASAHAAGRATTRVLAYNVAMLPKNPTGIGSRPATFDKIDPVSRADAISNRILDGNYDVVELDEVWTDQAKQEFLKRLGPSFPFHATQLWGHCLVCQDSGMMLFSKFPPIDNPYVPKVTKTIGFGTIGWDFNRLFDPIGNPFGNPPTGRDFGFYSCVDPASLSATGPSGGGAGGGMDWIHMDNVSPQFTGCSLAFHLYPLLVSDDQYADKGIGYVRLQDTRANRPLNVFFTHNQAIYWDNGPKPYHQHSADVEAEIDSNGQAFAEEAAFMNLFVPPANPSTWSEDTIAIGDHNVPGDTPYYDWAMNGPNQDGMQSAGARDTFRTDQSPSGEDPGYTWNSANSAVPADDTEGNDRLDYVFDRAGKRAPDCALQLRNMNDWKVRGFELPPFGDPTAVGTDLSDHYPLEVTLGAQALWCSPAKALLDPLAANQSDVNVPGQISYGGAYQWIRFDGSDTLKVHITAPVAMNVTAYAANDLTNPIDPDLGSADQPANAPRTTDVTYSNPGRASAIYLRIRAVDDTWSGSYSVHVHRADGSSMADAITLHDKKSGSYSLATFEQGLQPGSEQFMLFFHIKTQELWSGQRQNMAFGVTQLDSLDPADLAKSWDAPDGYYMQIRDSKGNIVSNSPNWIDKYIASWGGQVVPEAAGDYYLVLYRRFNPVKRPTAYVKVTWASDLRTIDLKSIWSYDKLFAGFGAAILIDNQPMPYDFDFGVVQKHQTAAWPVASPGGNPAPLDQHEINIADNIAIQPMLPGLLTPPVTITRSGGLGEHTLDMVPGIVTLKYDRS